ncbi:MAG: 5-methyltetrahydropteroyltriglutamate--homocysteine methyltransferase [Elusimicrobia bacterium]|nr:5-methyltetrahydropteroyltriglutamate--homocysteine methyltransferase [Elusimicrobiota bacterium]
MINISTAHIGSLPRIGEGTDLQRHKRGTTHYERKEISAHAYRDVEESVILELIREQELIGLDEVTDGLVRWEDPISHFCFKLKGFERGGLRRYFDTNFYFRSPLIASRPRGSTPFLVKEFSYAKSITHKNVRPVLTGPLTLAHHTHSTLKGYSKAKDRMIFFSEIIAQEVKALNDAGALRIQIDEPALAQNNSDLRMALQCLEKINAKRGQAKIILAFPFFSINSLADKLKSIPVQGFNFDLTALPLISPKKLIPLAKDREMGLGVVSALNTKLETLEDLRSLIEPWTPHFPFLCLTPSSGLEFLPRSCAFEKLKRLNDLKFALGSPSPEGVA